MRGFILTKHHSHIMAKRGQNNRFTLSHKVNTLYNRVNDTMAWRISLAKLLSWEYISRECIMQLLSSSLYQMTMHPFIKMLAEMYSSGGNMNLVDFMHSEFSSDWNARWPLNKRSALWNPALWVFPMRDFSVSRWTPTEGNSNDCQSMNSKWTGWTRQCRCHWSHCWTSDREWTLQPLRRAVRQEVHQARCQTV